METRLNNNELKWIKKKWKILFLANLSLAVLSSVIMYNIRYVIIIALFALWIFIFSIIKLVRSIFKLNNVIKDVRNKIKIKTKVTVKSKEKISSTTLKSGTFKYTYKLIFYKNEYLKEYYITQKSFKIIQKGDIIELQCSKYTKDLISLNFNNLNIKNSFYDKLKMVYKIFCNHFQNKPL